jgi:DNA repair protein RadA/Sms
MARTKTAFVCSDCGSEHAKWQGQCSDCGVWNTLKQVNLGGPSGAVTPPRGYTGQWEAPQTLKEVSAEAVPRIASGSKEFDRVLGGGLVPGSAILVSGEPGAGKSTLLIQTMCRLATQHQALYVTGEESLAQLAMRARRLQLPQDDLHVMAQTSVEAICSFWDEYKPAMVVVDSIQVMHLDQVDSAPGGIVQVRESASALIRKAKQTGAVLLLVGHVTKDGSLAGPRVLEHMIDCFVMLEGDQDACAAARTDSGR